MVNTFSTQNLYVPLQRERNTFPVHAPKPMKFTVNSKILLAKLVAASKAIPSKRVLAVLGSFLFELEGDTLSVTASDSENVIVVRAKVHDTDGDGKVCIDAKRITDLLKAMPACEVEFNVNEIEEVVVKHPNGRYKLVGIPSTEYPDLIKDEANVKAEITLTSAQILCVFDRVGFAMSVDELRPQMKGIYWDVYEDGITFVATDTHILSKYRITSVTPNVRESFIMPDRAVALVRGVLGKDSKVKVSATDTSIIIDGEEFTLRSPQLKGRFPDYNRVIPTINPNVAYVNASDFTDAINRVVVCAESERPMLKLAFGNGHLIATAKDMEYNTTGEEKVACATEGNPQPMGFSAPLLRSCVCAITSQNATIKMSEPSRPALILPSEQEENAELTILIMPMNLG